MTVSIGRRRDEPGPWRRLLAPISGLATGALGRLHLWVIGMVVLYCGSGITRVGPDEVAIVLRLGRVVNQGTAQATHPSGMLFALPRPFDEVVHVNVQRILEAELITLVPPDDEEFDPSTLDPAAVGYAVTGDHNIVHARFSVRYKVSDPVAFALRCAAPESVLSDALTAETVRAVGRRSVDDVLSEGRADLVAEIKANAQRRLDAGEVGLSLVSLDLTQLGPPMAVSKAFKEVQSAAITAQTKKADAETDKAKRIPAAEATAAEALSDAEKYAVSTRASAEADATAFRALVAEYRKEPAVVRERLYRDAIGQVFAQAGKREFLPPPVGGRYPDVRVSISTGKAP
jgi:membrane protease subunit HflK